MPSDTIGIVITPRQAELVLEHGYPFDEVKTAMRALLKRGRPVRVRLSVFDWEHVTGELSRTINHAARDYPDIPDAVIYELNDICEEVEAELA
jgi:hypothetical protein